MNETSRLNSIWRGEKVELRAKTRDDISRFVADGVADDMRLYGDGYVVFPASEEVMVSNNEKSLGYPREMIALWRLRAWMVNLSARLTRSIVTPSRVILSMASVFLLSTAGKVLH